MDAKVVDKAGVYIVSLSGQMNFEAADSLKNRCTQLFSAKKVVFNMRELNFVGSSGITPFLDLLRHLLTVNGRSLKVCAVGNEFMRLFEAGHLNGLEVYENETQACMAFDFMDTQMAAAPMQACPVVQQFVPDLGLDVNIED